MRSNLLRTVLLCGVTVWLVSCSSASGGGTPATTDGSNDSGPEQRKEGSKYIKAAYELRTAGKISESFVEINKAVETDKNNYYAWQLRGDINHMMNKSEDAIEDLTKAIALKPDEAGLYYSKAKYEGDVRKFDAALEDAKKAVTLDPKNLDYLYMRGSGYAIAQEYKKAIADATAVISADPKNQAAYRLRAVCYFKTGQKAKSAADDKMYQQLAASSARVIPVNGMQ